MSLLKLQNVPLELLTNALLGSAPMVTITSDYAALIQSVPNYQSLVIVENDNWSIGYNGKLIEPLPSGIFRLWTRQDYIQAGNMQRSQIARLEAATTARNVRRQTLIDLFTKQGLMPSIAKQLVDGLSDDTITTSISTLTQQS